MIIGAPPANHLVYSSSFLENSVWEWRAIYRWMGPPGDPDRTCRLTKTIQCLFIWCEPTIQIFPETRVWSTLKWFKWVSQKWDLGWLLKNGIELGWGWGRKRNPKQSSFFSKTYSSSYFCAIGIKHKILVKIRKSYHCLMTTWWHSQAMAKK